MFLPKPNTQKSTAKGGNSHLQYWKSEMQGWRISMEDAFLALPDFDGETALFCIFDGHGGPEVADFCHRHFATELKKSPFYAKGSYPEALKATFFKMDELMQTPEGRKELVPREGQTGLPNVFAGCTALAVLVTPDQILVANAGDCRCLVFEESGEVLVMNIEHKPQNVEENARIYRGGGMVRNGRVNGILNLSRALGDLRYKGDLWRAPADQVISGEPEVVVKKRESADLFMLLGCDGVYEKLSDLSIRDVIFDGFEGGEDMLDVLNSLLDQTCAPEFKRAFGGYDNMSAILVHLKPLKDAPSGNALH